MEAEELQRDGLRWVNLVTFHLESKLGEGGGRMVQTRIECDCGCGKKDPDPNGGRWFVLSRASFPPLENSGKVESELRFRNLQCLARWLQKSPNVVEREEILPPASSRGDFAYLK